jgi:transcriptional regulator with XRE-family HTH domain
MSKPYDDEETLRRLYHEEALTQEEVADELGCSTVTLRRYMSKHGVETRDSTFERREFFENEEEELRRLYWVEGLTAAEISDRATVDVSDVAVLNRMDEYGIERRDSAADRPPGVYIHPEYYPYVRHYDGEEEHIVKTHRLLAVAKYGFEAVRNNDVHHTTGFKQDNRPEVIELVSHSDHQREHSSNPEDVPVVVDDLSKLIPHTGKA